MIHLGFPLFRESPDIIPGAVTISMLSVWFSILGVTSVNPMHSLHNPTLSLPNPPHHPPQKKHTHTHPHHKSLSIYGNRQVNADELDLPVWVYMGTLACFWLLNFFIVYPIAQPNLFRMLRCICSIVRCFSTRVLLGLISAAFLYTYIFLCSGLLLGLTPSQHTERFGSFQKSGT